jgi:hypothetical protein
MLKKITFIAIIVMLAFTLSGCNKTGTQSTNQTASTGDKSQGTSTGYVTDRTDYVIFYNQSTPADLGGIATHQYIVGHPIPAAETIKYNAYFVPWRIDFSQVQRTTQPILAAACDNVKEQVVYIEGWIDIDFSDLGVKATDLPDLGPAKPKGTIHEKVTGEAGSWVCKSDLINKSVNQGSIDYITSVSGDHVANFSDASNITNMTISGADIYLDLSMPENIQFIWPAGTKIEYAPEGTPVPLEPLSPNNL